MEFVDLVNVGLLGLNWPTRNIVGTLEAWSENNFPVYVLTQKCSWHVCTTLEGEIYNTVNCRGNSAGYTCCTKVTQP